MNYFELFDIPISLNPDKNQVRQKFFELSRRYHPDFFTQENEFEQSEALEKASGVNKGLKVLQNQDETIKYVLQLKGLLEEEEKYQLPPDFLMEMMDLNEEMMDAKMEQDEESLARIRKSIAGVQQEIFEPVKGIVEGYEEGKTTTEELLKVKEYYYKKKYLSRILATIG
jgi:molecular chaperone HscB